MYDIIKAVFKTGSASLIGILLGAVSTKVMAVILGPNGVGLFSLIRQTLATAVTAGTVGGQTALVQGLASKEGNERDRFLITVFWIFILGAISIAVGLLLLAPWIAKIVFTTNDNQTISLVRWMALPGLLMIIFSYLISVLNGFRAIGRLALGQIIVSMVTISLVYPVSKLVSSGYINAFVWMMAASTLGGIIFCFIIAYKEKWLNPLILNFRPQFDKNAIKYFSRVSGTTLITGLIATGTLLIIRGMIVQYGGLASAGIFDVAWALSMTYVMLLLGSFGTYYLPTLSGINDIQTRITLIKKLFRLSILFIVPLIVSLIVLKPLVIQLLYSDKFIPALEIIRWMLIGDYFKVVGWVLAMPVLAYADMKVFFWTELLWNGGFLVLSTLAIFFYKDLQGIGIAFIILYFFISVYYLYYVYSKHQLPITKTLLKPWFYGLILIILASLQTWSTIHVNWVLAAIWILLSIAFSWYELTKNEKNKLFNIMYIRRS